MQDCSTRKYYARYRRLTELQFTIADNAVNATKLNVTGDGTNTQFLQSDGDGSFTWNVPTDTTYTASTGLGLTGTAFSLDLANDQTWTGSQRGQYYC